MINYMLISNKPDFAYHAVQSGVQRIFVDLEIIGKKERQGHLDTFISQHVMADVAKMKSAINGTGAELLVRLNPFYSGTKIEIEEAIARGANILMLPMFTTVQEVSDFCVLVNKRAKVIPLVETGKSLDIINELVTLPGITEIFFGLNDLHLDLKLTFMFELLTNGLLEDKIKTIKKAGIPFGIGGIARVGEGALASEIILGEHLRLGSSSVILSRTFHKSAINEVEMTSFDVFSKEFTKLIDVEIKLRTRTAEEIEFNKILIKRRVDEIVGSREQRKVL